MESERVRVILGAAAVEHRSEVGAAAEPPLGGDDEPGVHVHRRDMRIARMNDERDTARPESGVLAGAGDAVAELGRKLSADRRAVDACLLEELAAQHGHDAAATTVL